MKKQKGIALLITLTITLLISITVKSLIENTTSEIKLISNYQNTFKTELLARSVFRLLIRNLLDFGPAQIQRLLSTYPEVLPIDEGYYTKPTFRSLDHYFYIGEKQKFIETRLTHNSDYLSGEIPMVIFRNLIQHFVQDFKLKDEYYRKKYKIKEKDDNLLASLEFISEYEIFQAIGAIIDWQDPDEIPNDINGFIGQEFYYSKQEDEVEFKTKNQKIEYVSELKVIPALQKLHLFDFEESHQHFFPFLSYTLKAHDVGCHYRTGKLNLNLLEKELEYLPPSIDPIQYQIESFFRIFSGIGYDNGSKGTTPCSYKSIQDMMETGTGTLLIKAIAKKIYEGHVFKGNITKDETFENLILDSGFTMKDPIVGFFIGKSEVLELKFSLTLGSVTKQITAHLKMTYEGTENSDKPSSIDILKYEVM